MFASSQELRRRIEEEFIESAIGMNWINETRFSRICTLLEPALRKHYGLSREATEFWSAHGEQDKEHSSIGPYLIERYAITPETRERVWTAAKRGAGVWMSILDATWDAYFADQKWYES